VKSIPYLSWVLLLCPFSSLLDSALVSDLVSARLCSTLISYPLDSALVLLSSLASLISSLLDSDLAAPPVSQFHPAPFAMSGLSYLTPATIAPVGGQSVQTFETRLREYIGRLKSAPNSQSRITLQWEADLAEHDVEYFASQISNRVTGDVKRMLGGDRPPTIAEIKQLPTVTRQHKGVGLYFLLALSKMLGVNPDARKAGYGGSSVRAGEALSHRVLSEHANEKFRKYKE